MTEEQLAIGVSGIAYHTLLPVHHCLITSQPILPHNPYSRQLMQILKALCTGPLCDIISTISLHPSPPLSLYTLFVILNIESPHCIGTDEVGY